GAKAATGAGGADNVHDNDTDSDSSAGLSNSALSLTFAGASTVAAGDTATYTATVHNAGPSDAVGVQAAVTLPAGLELVSAKVGGVDCTGAVCTLGTVAS